MLQYLRKVVNCLSAAEREGNKVRRRNALHPILRERKKGQKIVILFFYRRWIGDCITQNYVENLRSRQDFISVAVFSVFQLE